MINSVSELLDMVLCSRLGMWFTPCREQAGAQKGRGCTEHIVTLRILSDVARRKKKKLFVTFIDFSKAYDLVPRHVAKSVIGSVAFAATTGVHLVYYF